MDNRIFNMKQLILAACLLAGVNVPAAVPPAQAPPAPAAKTSAKPEWVDFSADLETVTADLKKKFDDGETGRTNLDENLQAINDLIVKHLKDGNREQLARLYLLDAHIYADGLTNSAKARAIWVQVSRDFPGTLAARGAAISLAKLNAAQSAAPDPGLPEGLAVGQRFPGFNASDIAGSALSTTAYRGQVTLVDFWATWCGPCREEMPNVIATYRQYHAQGFAIIGVSLDSQRDAVLRFTRALGMPWQQYFDGKGWSNQLAKKYGVESIPMDYLLDRHGVVVGKELRGKELGAAVQAALQKN